MVFLEVQTIRRRTEADVDVDRGLEELTRERMVECDGCRAAGHFLLVWLKPPGLVFNGTLGTAATPDVSQTFQSKERRSSPGR